MKTSKKIILWGLFAGCCVAFILYVVLTRGAGDHQPPEITVPESTLQLSVYEDDGVLLRDAAARDAQDGDVTDLIIVEAVSDIYDGNKAVVTYAAFDRSGNVAKAERPVEYIDYAGPRFTLTGPLIFQEGLKLDVFGPVGAMDMMDGTLNEKIKGTLMSGQSSVDRAGVYEVEFRVTNSLGDTAHLRVPVEVTPGSSVRRRLELTSYLVYLEQGSAFDPREYLTGASWEFLDHVEDHVDTAEPGIYTADYVDINGEAYGKTRLIAVVEE